MVGYARNAVTPLEKRNTHKYVGSWQHEDDWSTLGTMTVLQDSTIETEEDICDPWQRLVLLQINDDVTAPEEDIKRALRDTFTKAGCSHDHDCCGCRSYYGKATLIDKEERTWLVIQTSSRNY